MRDFSDEQLVTLVLEGRNDAFRILVERYQKQIFALAYRLGGDHDEAQDMAQEAFVRIYQELAKFDCSRRFFPWMYRVAHNTCVNLLHKRPKDTTSLDTIFDAAEADAGGIVDPSRQTEEKELHDVLNEALQTLPENYRLPLIMKYLENMSYQEISQHLGLPVSTIETRLFRGRKMLKDFLRQYLF